MSYAFGDSNVAATRLKVVARVFERTTQAFLESTDLPSPELAVDLGCGPGYTTELLAEVLGGGHTAGLDLSPQFIELARRVVSDARSFHVHDVTVVPFPAGPADLLYCRFLLTHIQEPATAIGHWATQLRPGGFLAVEEPESIETNSEVFERYLKIVEEMLRSQSSQLYVGAQLEGAKAPQGLAKRSSRIGELRAAPTDAATMFSLNLRTWRSHPFVRKRLTSAEVLRLQRDLESLRGNPPAGTEIVWKLRQLVYERI